MLLGTGGDCSQPEMLSFLNPSLLLPNWELNTCVTVLVTREEALSLVLLIQFVCTFKHHLLTVYSFLLVFSCKLNISYRERHLPGSSLRKSAFIAELNAVNWSAQQDMHIFIPTSYSHSEMLQAKGSFCDACFFCEATLIQHVIKVNMVLLPYCAVKIHLHQRSLKGHDFLQDKIRENKSITKKVSTLIRIS